MYRGGGLVTSCTLILTRSSASHFSTFAITSAFLLFQIMLLQFLPLVQLAAFTTAVAAALELKDCFSADGAPAPDNVPCDPTANVSSCCGPTWVCATNLYCRSRNDPAANFVGTCTDRTWKDPACPFIQSQLSSHVHSFALSLVALLKYRTPYCIYTSERSAHVSCATTITELTPPRARHQGRIPLQPFQLYSQYHSLQRYDHLPLCWQYNLLRYSRRHPRNHLQTATRNPYQRGFLV